MKRLLTALAVASLSCAAFVLPANAQDAPPPAMSGTQLPNPDQVVSMLAAKLALTDAQQSQIKPIIVDRQQKIAALKADTSLRRGKRLREMKSVLDASDTRINAVLNDQQKQQYAQLEQQMREQFRERMKESQGAAGGAQ
jgi:periplasmic protein CpxP/Spy